MWALNENEVMEMVNKVTTADQLLHTQIMGLDHEDYQPPRLPYHPHSQHPLILAQHLQSQSGPATASPASHTRSIKSKEVGAQPEDDLQVEDMEEGEEEIEDEKRSEEPSVGKAVSAFARSIVADTGMRGSRASGTAVGGNEGTDRDGAESRTRRMASHGPNGERYSNDQAK